MAPLLRESIQMLLTAKTDAFEFDLTLNQGKGAFRHRDDGVLVMGGAEDPLPQSVQEGVARDRRVRDQ
jgi:hypothetical protein